MSAAEGEFFLHLRADDLENTLGRFTFDGSAVQQNVTVEAGDILTFDWNFLTDECRSDDIPETTGVITDVSGGDRINLRNILIGADFASATPFAEYVELVQLGGNTRVQVDGRALSDA